jgi:purine-binding chemotaxis protein CheW
MAEEGHRSEGTEPLLVFFLDGRELAFPLAVVLRAFFSVEVTQIPSSPDIIIGVINYHGTIIPVVDLRIRFSVSKREILPSDRFILIRTKRRRLVVVASEVYGVLRPSYALKPVEDILPGARYISGILPHDGQLILIHDPDLFLSLEEEIALDTALAGAGEVQ